MIALVHPPSPQMAACELTHVARVPIDVQLAGCQHAAYCRMLEDCGVEVRPMTGNLHYPDCAFIEDTAIVLDEVTVIGSMGAASRRGETTAIERELAKLMPVERVEPPATIEGGDVLRVGRRLFVGSSSRTNRAGLNALQRIANRHGYEVTPVEVRDSLHFKTACTALPDGSLLVNPEWIDVSALKGFETIVVPETEPWSANVLLAGGTVCLAAGQPKMENLIRARGFNVCTADISEFAKAEGGMTCLSLLIGDG